MAKSALLESVRRAIRLRHYSIRTEQAYCGWIKRYILFHHKRHPNEMGAREVTAFLTYLAADCNVAASTQNQALNSLVFLYREVLYPKRLKLRSNCTPYSSHDCVEIPCNSPAITRHFALLWNEYDTHLTPKSQTLWV